MCNLILLCLLWNLQECSGRTTFQCITTTKYLIRHCTAARQETKGRQCCECISFTNGNLTWTDTGAKTNPRSRRRTELTHQSTYTHKISLNSVQLWVNTAKMTRSALISYIFGNNEDSSSRRQLSVFWMQSMESVFDKAMCKTVLLWLSAWGCREFHSSQPVTRSTVHNIWSQLER